jgi:uncharacterized protein YqgC (DUF456 family)
VTAIVILSAVLVLVGLVGVVVPFLPGSALVFLGVLVWSAATATTAGWLVLAGAGSLLVGGALAKYAVPGRRLRDSGIPTSTLAAGAVLGVVGFFVVPVVGLPLGFVLGVYLAELRRLAAHATAWRATVSALEAVGLGMLIEFVAALLAAGTWATAVVMG